MFFPQSFFHFIGHQADVDVVRWHPNCHYLATGSSDRSVRLWDVRNGTCSRLLTGHRAAITSLAMSPDGKSLTSGDATGAVLSWDLGSARCVAKAPAAHAGPVWSLAYSQGEGSVLASGGADCTVKLWDSARGSASGSGGVLGQQEARPKEDAALMLLTTWTTRATPVLSVQFSRRNLMLCSGPLTLQRPVGSG
jgi:transcription initiation factor TFIID subunit 5